MIVYRNPLPEQMGEVLKLRWNVLRDPNLPMDGTETDMYDTNPMTVHGALFQIGFGSLLVATGRIHIPEESPEVRQLRYMAVRPNMSRRGYGAMLLQNMELEALSIKAPVAAQRFEANARVSALPFYKELGYSAIGNEFDVVGVRHVKVTKDT